MWARPKVRSPSTCRAPSTAVAPNLRWVQAIGAGIDHLEGAELPEHVTITNAAGSPRHPLRSS